MAGVLESVKNCRKIVKKVLDKIIKRLYNIKACGDTEVLLAQNSRILAAFKGSKILLQ